MSIKESITKQKKNGKILYKNIKKCRESVEKGKRM